MPLNLATLEVHEDVEIPTTRRGRPATDNPMLSTFQSSIDGGYKNLGIPGVPAEDTRELVNLIRYAANALHVGARVYLSNTAGQELGLARKTNDDGTPTGLDVIVKETGEPWTDTVNVWFRAQKRKAKKGTNGQTSEASDDTDTVDDSTPDSAPTDDSNTEAETVTEETAQPDATAGKRRRTR